MKLYPNGEVKTYPKGEVMIIDRIQVSKDSVEEEVNVEEETRLREEGIKASWRIKERAIELEKRNAKLEG